MTPSLRLYRDHNMFADGAGEPQAISQRVDRQSCGCQTEVGHGVQRCGVDSMIRSCLHDPKLDAAHVATGYLVSVDAYMNLQLANTEEFIEGQFTGNLGEVLIRYVYMHHTAVASSTVHPICKAMTC